MALDEKGFLRPTYDELLEDRIEQAKALFGDDIDTSEHTAIGKFIRLAVYDLAKAWESLELCYYSRFPNTASGVNLDRLLPFAGITRNPATRAQHKVKFTGESNFAIPVGFLVGTAQGVTFYLVNGVTLDANGYGEGTVECTELGTVGNVTLGMIAEIVNPDASVAAVEHTDIIQLGEDTEPDAALRERFATTIAGAGSSTAASIQGAIMRVSGVKDCIIVENASDATDAEGRPAHSFECYVYAPASLDGEIAEAIYSKKPLGIQSYGDTSVVVNEKTIGFTHTEEVTVKIKAVVKYDDSFGVNGVSEIKTALIDYINNLGNGGDVIYSALFGRIHSVQGVKETTSLQIASGSGSFITSNLVMNSKSVPVATADSISIEVTAYVDND